MSDDADREPLAHSRRSHRRVLAVVVVAVACAAVGFVVARATQPTPPPPAAASPADDSADAGFARDMSEHHAQAVEMATVLGERTTDPDLQILAKDIALTQQAQIGRMSGWLDEWGLTTARSGPAMAWMGASHHGDGSMSGSMPGSMPGMASRADVDRLGTLPVGEAETLFLQLMIRHHRGGIDMANGALAEAQRPNVRLLAEGIVDAQESEITAMTDLLRARGADVPT